jgi:MinD-like ATPase involved in chromosome partitioning or flagellar assembly
MTQSIAPQLLTWLDVERVFRKTTGNFARLPTDTSKIQCFADGVEIECGDTELAKDWLGTLFGRAYRRSDSAVTLQIAGHLYPINLVSQPLEQRAVSSVGQYPLWRDQAYADAALETPAEWDEPCRVTAFHSFKGGVGRTTSLITYAAARIASAQNSSARILLIDADVEAPGITFWLTDENRPSVSFVSFLEAIHYPPTSVSEVLEYFAVELRKTSISSGSRREIFVLPAALDMSQVMDMTVLPEHIARNTGNKWALTDRLHALGKLLGVDHVFIDLRAGLSELSSPLLFDPRVEHFFVTTVAKQSVSGTATVLSYVHKAESASVLAASTSKPTVIVSLLTPPLKESAAYTQAVEMLNQAYPAQTDEAITSGLEWIEAPFAEFLMSISSLKQAFEVLPLSPLYRHAVQWADTQVAVDKVTQTLVGTTPVPQSEEARQLQGTCDKFQFAERATADEMLVTDPVRNLAKHFATELPNVVSVGAKGAGKTFTYLQICRTNTWRSFLKVAGQTYRGEDDAVIYPYLYSQNLGAEFNAVVRSTRTHAVRELGVQVSSAFQTLGRKIADALRDLDTDWDAFWERVLVEEFLPSGQSVAELNDWLGASRKSLVVMIDGLEDLFDSPEDHEQQRNALKALLLLPNKLANLAERRIGLICFVRADYVQLVIKQNVAQYLARFQPFRLEWTAESFLRLAYWICGKAKVLGADADKAEVFTVDQLLSALEALWGKKMGHDGAKEANTARWVFAALCDLNGRLQARDLVRFLKFSAGQMLKGQPNFWPDRLLNPEAIRRSLPECSNEKVSEAVSEIKVLREWTNKLESISSEYKKVPFNADAVGLTNELRAALKELGIIYEDVDEPSEPNRFYLPEIYRWGLGFQSAGGGRPRVQALLKRNLGGMPF